MGLESFPHFVFYVLMLTFTAAVVGSAGTGQGTRDDTSPLVPLHGGVPA